MFLLTKMKNRGIKYYFTLLFCLSSFQLFNLDMCNHSIERNIYDGLFKITVLIVIANCKIDPFYSEYFYEVY